MTKMTDAERLQIADTVVSRTGWERGKVLNVIDALARDLDRIDMVIGRAWRLGSPDYELARFVDQIQRSFPYGKGNG